MRRLSMDKAILGLVLIAALTACGSAEYAPTPLPDKPGSAPSQPARAQPEDCDNALQTYQPDGPLPAPGAMPPVTTMEKIQRRGYLIAGVSADSLNLGARNPITGAIEGFDIDMVLAITRAIFGTTQGKLRLRVISSPQRIPMLKSGKVDIVARNMTINCARWKEIAFSAEYYRAGQKLLVRRDLRGADGRLIDSLDQMAGMTVCAPAGSTSLENVRARYPDVKTVTADTDTGCLVKFQQGEADGITGDDTVLAGEAAQDPYARIAKQKAFTDEPYGLGIHRERRDFVKFVNGVLEQLKASGQWQKSYDTWLRPTLQVPAVPPKAVYGRVG